MKVSFKNKKIEEICTNEKKAIKKYGQFVAKKLFIAIDVLRQAISLNDVYLLANYKLHSLHGNLNNKLSMYLGAKTGYRLIITPLDDNGNIIINDKNMIVVKAVHIEIEEVSKHYE